MSKVLVTGASGFVGRHCLDPLVEAGFEVHAVSRHPGPPGTVHWHQADLLESSERRALIADVAPTHFLHLAWCTEHGRFWDDPANSDWAVATLDIAHAFAAAGGTRFVATGSCAEYDWSTAHAGPLHETATPRRPASVYGRAKLSTQESVAAFAQEAGLTYAWAVLFFLIGPGEKPGRLVPSVITGLLEGRPVQVTSGTQIRDLIDVRDAARALAALLSSDVEGRVNVGSGHGTVLSELCRRIAASVGRPDLLKLGSMPMRPNEPPVLTADVRRLMTEVDFTPAHSLEESVASATAWWRSSTAASYSVKRMV